MKILAIETSCDETAISILEAEGGTESPRFNVLSNIVLSQAKLHEKYGGVFPNLAKREHSKNLVPVLKKALEEAGLLKTQEVEIDEVKIQKINANLSHEKELAPAIIAFLKSNSRPNIDLIAVTSGPGLEPALWVGISAAKILGEFWNFPVMPVNHMEGHIYSVLLNLKSPIEFPAIALLISGGHTELVEISDWSKYKIIGETRDDAVGEAFDKVARMLDLPYPGGPQISALAEEARNAGVESRFNFPRPMIKSQDLDFSFSGLKTSVLYTIRKIGNIDLETKKEIAVAFEDAIIETIVAKTKKAIVRSNPKTLIIAGGVVANQTIRKAFDRLVGEFENIKLLVPTNNLSTDNALMIGLATYVTYSKKPNQKFLSENIKAEGNLRLS